MNVVFAAALAVGAILPPSAAQQVTSSAHRIGPQALEGWTLTQTEEGIPEPVPYEVVVARRGKVLRRIEGEPTVWKWMFQENGRTVAVKVGPLHFSATCELVSIATGKQLAEYDCYHDLPPDAPAWVRSLEASPL